MSEAKVRVFGHLALSNLTRRVRARVSEGDAGDGEVERVR